jgi:hypothetical protein
MCSKSAQRRASNGCASRLKHAVDADAHFLFFDELAPVSLFNALSDASAKARVVLTQPQRRVLHQLLGINALMSRYLRKTYFLLGSEMHFHKVSVEAEPGRVKPIAGENDSQFTRRLGSRTTLRWGFSTCGAMGYEQAEKESRICGPG